MKKLKQKNKLMMLGVMVVVTAPIIAVASCGASKDADNQDIQKSVAYLKNGLFVDNDLFQPIKKTSSITLEKFLNENRKLKPGEYVEVKDDITVLANAYYSGKVQDISTIYNKSNPGAFGKMQYTTPFKYINGSAVLPTRNNTISQWGASRPVLQMGKGDSLIYFFDKDDKDGRSLYGFKKQIMFEDSSISGDKTITAINKLIGLKKGPGSWGSYSRVPFIGNRNKGVLTSYYGSQNNHNPRSAKVAKAKTTEEWVKIEKHLRSIFPQKVVDKIMEYYKTASKSFIPTEVPFGYIKYEIIGPNAIKVDFSSEPRVTASHIGWISENGKKSSWDAELSIGDSKEWAAYNAHEGSDYLIIGKH